MRAARCAQSAFWSNFDNCNLIFFNFSRKHSLKAEWPTARWTILHDGRWTELIIIIPNLQQHIKLSIRAATSKPRRQLGSKASPAWSTPPRRQIPKIHDARQTKIIYGRQTRKYAKNQEKNEKFWKMKKCKKLKNWKNWRCSREWRGAFSREPSKRHRKGFATMHGEPRMKRLDRKRKCSTTS